VYDELVRVYPNSPRAASALYKQGLLAEQRGDRAAARTFYSRVIAGYPRSPEADLARQNQQRLRQ
jgi:TolA-binding protein